MQMLTVHYDNGRKAQLSFAGEGQGDIAANSLENCMKLKSVFSLDYDKGKVVIDGSKVQSFELTF